MIHFSATTVGIERTIFALGRVDTDIKDMRNFEPYLADEFRRIEENLFASEGVTGGSGKWAPLEDKYAKWKAEHFPGAGILTRDSALRDSLTIEGAPFSVVESSKDEVFMGTEVPYGQWHRDASGPPGLPQRLPIDITDADMLRFAKAAQIFVERSISNAFGSSAPREEEAV